jgi:predicted MFS family arabinose efflux permease
MGIAIQKYVFYCLFFLYGVYAAATEGVSKAWISNVIDKKDTATAIGTYASFQSIATMIASTTAGLLWYTFGPSVVFISSGVVAGIVVVYFIWFNIKTVSAASNSLK